MEGNSKNTVDYQKEIFQEITHYVEVIEGINNIILAEDINQSIGSIEVQDFFQNLSIKDVYLKYNIIPIQNIDNIFIRGLLLIDIIVMSAGIIQFVEGYRLFEMN